MPATSEAQRRAACTALAAKRGQRKPGSLQGAARSMFQSMNEAQLKEFCEQPVQS